MIKYVGVFAALLFAVGCGGKLPEGGPGDAVQTADESDAGESVDTGEVDAGQPYGGVIPGAPIVAPKEAWTWVDVPGAVCADGSATGFGVNLTDKSDDVLIFLEGGGACWDGTSCWGPVQTAFYVATGYDELAFKTDPQIPMMYVLNRDDSTNPFRNKNIVYVPYCTGDSYAGDTVKDLEYLGTTHKTHFKGYRNLGLYLSRIISTFPKAKRVWLAGDSAGGFGSAFNAGRVQAAFPNARLDVLDDSGQPISPSPEKWAQWKSVWNMQFPADCTNCGNGPGEFLEYYRSKFASNRYGLISFDYDPVIAPFMALSLGDFHDELYAAMDRMDSTWPQAHYFVIPGASHVGLATPSADLKAWVNAMVSDDPSWQSVKP